MGVSGRGGVLPERAGEHEHGEDLVAVLVDVVELFEVTFLFLFLRSEKKPNVHETCTYTRVQSDHEDLLAIFDFVYFTYS